MIFRRAGTRCVFMRPQLSRDLSSRKEVRDLLQADW
jgi:hypothetical protein